jgi:predicted ATPase
MRPDLPSGTITFLFTDVEGSTKLLHALGTEAYAEALAEHRRILREAFARHGGVEIDTQGDAFFVAFPTAPGALAAATEACEALEARPIKVRMGLHTGTPLLTAEGYVGADVHRAARIASAGHGGQLLVSAATAALLDGAGLRDLGEHRLKDLSAPERIFQLGAGDFPPLKTLYHTNLPIPATPFLGREQELAEVTALIVRGDVRILTLTGPGGTGKTRLALQSAGSVSESYPEGSWWVPLAPLRDPRLVLETAGKTLGSSGELAAHIGDKRLLLLLDNFEHLVDAAGDLAPLVAQCPNLSILVTSREPLRLGGEWEYAVDPLHDTDAVALFTARAQAVKRDFEANGEVRQICARLDNLPLAIELAAARVKLMSAPVLLQRLERALPMLTGATRDAPDRQRTLAATIAWSYDLLTAEEQRLFRRLAVFRGGWTLEAAEWVADATLDALQSLVDKSLVRVRDDRFWMLETIREFAAEQLDASGERDDLAWRHGEHFLALAEEAQPHIHRDSQEWIDRLEAEHDNIRAGLDRLETAGADEMHLRLAGALWRFWYHKSHLLEGRRRLERALSLHPEPDAARASALHGAAVMALNLGDTSAARQHADEARDLERSLGHLWGVAYATMMIGNALAESRELAEARPFLEESARLFGDLGDAQYALIANTNVAWVTGELGDLDAEKRAHAENLARARELGHRAIEAGSLAQLAGWGGRFDEGARLLRDAIRIDNERGNPLDIATNLARLASVLAPMGEARLAAQLVACSDALIEGLGADSAWWNARRNEKTLAALAPQMSEAELADALADGRRLTLDEAVALALAESAS